VIAYKKQCEKKYNELLKAKALKLGGRMSVNELKKIVNYISEYTFGVKFDKNGNYNEFKYNRNYKRGIYTRDDIRKEMVEIFG
jgi:hypothetical protein